jgi:flagellar motor switch protein FliN/FliY
MSQTPSSPTPGAPTPAAAPSNTAAAPAAQPFRPAEMSPQNAIAPVSPAAEVPLSMLLDLSLPVSIELGRTSMTVQEILRLGRGSVIQLERLAGEPIDVFVGDRRFAEGEVVILGETFGVRITRILPRSQSEEMAQ